MTHKEIARLRLINQQVAFSRFNSAKELLGWIGALQAQDFPMVKWAAGLRVKGSTEPGIETSIDKGEIIRTHLLRPTWHLVSSEDLFWMVELSATKIRTALKTRHKQLGMTDAVIKICNRIIKEALTGSHHLTRDELAVHLQKAGITNENNRLAHILLYAETETLICSGKSKGNQQTYALVEERIGKSKGISKEDALEMIASKYFLSRGPATLQDFKWWSGLPSKDARHALESADQKLDHVIIGSETFWMGNSEGSLNDDKPAVFLLPAYDEFLIGYTDRSASLLKVHVKNAISDNGIFKPVIVSDGQVIGIWKKKSQKENVLVECHLFKSAGKAVKSKIESTVEKYGQFLNKSVQVNFIEIN